MTAIDEWLATVDAERLELVVVLRDLVLAADPRVREAIKWNAGSFLIADHFATFNLREPGAVRLILHAGAKRRARPLTVGAVADPSGQLAWLGDDRAMLEFTDRSDFDDRSAHVEGVVRAWIAAVAPTGGRPPR